MTFQPQASLFPWVGINPASSSAPSIVRSIAADEAIKEEAVELCCWRTAVSAAFSIGARPLHRNTAARLMRPSDRSTDEDGELHLDIREWKKSKGGIVDALTYVVNNYLDGNISMIKTGTTFRTRRFILPSGEQVSGDMLLRAIAKLERPDMNASQAYKVIGGGEIARIVREQYLTAFYETQDCDSSFEILRDVLIYIIQKYYDGDINGINGSPIFTNKKFRLSSGMLVSGKTILFSIASKERPDITATAAFNELKGKELVRIAKEKYLKGYYEEQDWRSTFEKVSAALTYVVETYLGGDVNRVTTTVDKFQSVRFKLPSGQVVTGKELLSAVARLEKPGMNVKDAIKALGNRKGVVRIARKKYLAMLYDQQNWGGTYDALRNTLEYVVSNYLEGDVSQVSCSTKFTEASFKLESGQIKSGKQLLYAVARLERPGLIVTDAIEAAGKEAEVARVAREKYLAHLYEEQDWGGTEERLTNTLKYVVEIYLDGDVTKVSSEGAFKQEKYLLPSGKIISGKQMMFAMARLEYPDEPAKHSYERMRKQKIIMTLLREKYLADLYEAYDWASTHEKLMHTLRYVLENYLDGEMSRINAGRYFPVEKFKLSSGQEVSGYELISAVAQLEMPGMSPKDAIRALGGRPAVIGIIRDKYLFSLDDTPESFVQAMKFMMGDDDDENGGDA